MWGLSLGAHLCTVRYRCVGLAHTPASQDTVYFECHLRFAAGHDRESNDARHFTTSFTACLQIPSPAHFFSHFFKSSSRNCRQTLTINSKLILYSKAAVLDHHFKSFSIEAYNFLQYSSSYRAVKASLTSSCNSCKFLGCFL